MCLITLEQVQRATAHCLTAHPVIDNTLPRESHALTDLLGRMYYEGIDAVDDAKVPSATLQAIQHWTSQTEVI